MKNLFLLNATDLSHLSSVVGVNVDTLISNVVDKNSNVVEFTRSNKYFDFNIFNTCDIYKLARLNPDNLYLFLSETTDLIHVNEDWGKFTFHTNGVQVTPMKVRIDDTEYDVKAYNRTNFICEGQRTEKVITKDYELTIELPFGKITVSLFDLLRQGINIRLVE